ncbi:MAG: transposase-like protein [Parasphingorhabdus sp.]|jgi:transposase-like protein
MIKGKLHYLWRAVDQDGDTLDILVQRRKSKKYHPPVPAFDGAE